MAKRTNKTTHDPKTKNLIKASQLLNRLLANAKGECEMTPTQVNSAKIYLAKFIPDLSSIEQEIHLPEWQLLDPAQIAIQAAQLLASNPAYLVDIMMADPAARSAVQQALDTVIATDQARVTPAVLDS